MAHAKHTIQFSCRNSLFWKKGSFCRQYTHASTQLDEQVLDIFMPRLDFAHDETQSGFDFVAFFIGSIVRVLLLLVWLRWMGFSKPLNASEYLSIRPVWRRKRKGDTETEKVWAKSAHKQDAPVHICTNPLCSADQCEWDLNNLTLETEYWFSDIYWYSRAKYV